MYIEFVQHSVVFARAVYLGAVFLGAVHLKYLLLHKTRNISKFHHVWTTFIELVHCVACRRGTWRRQQ